jgi:hypothetical protein
MISIPFFLGASVMLAYVLAAGLFLLGLCRAAARTNCMSAEAEPLINLPPGTPGPTSQNK